MQAPQRMHFSECQKSGNPSRRLRPLSTSTMCSSPPFLGPVKWEEYWVNGAPSALRASNRRNTPMSSTRGIIFSISMLAMWRGGMDLNHFYSRRIAPDCSSTFRLVSRLASNRQRARSWSIMRLRWHVLRRCLRCRLLYLPLQRGFIADLCFLPCKQFFPEFSP